jgi:hypothetical protein
MAANHVSANNGTTTPRTPNSVRSRATLAGILPLGGASPATAVGPLGT